MCYLSQMESNKMVYAEPQRMMSSQQAGFELPQFMSYWVGPCKMNVLRVL
jgi:hypothetical protein